MSVNVYLALVFAIVLSAPIRVAAATSSPVAISSKRATPTTAALLARVQEHVGRLAAAGEAGAEDAASLTRALVAGKGRSMNDTAIGVLARSLAAAIAQGSFDEEGVERLAQNVFAAVNNRNLTSREASLLVLDVSMVLVDAGADRPAVDAVIGDLSAICPAGTERAEADAASARPTRPPMLTRRSPPSP
jgi:hypothetical protein